MDVLVSEVQALASLCRSFLGPCKSVKCVIADERDSNSNDGNSNFATNAYDLLHALDGNPTSTTLLLELIDAQQQGSGSGTSWLLALLSSVLGAATQLLRQGAPLAALLAGLEEGLQLCEQVAHDSSISITDLAATLSNEQLIQEWRCIRECATETDHEHSLQESEDTQNIAYQGTRNNRQPDSLYSTQRTINASRQVLLNNQQLPSQPHRKIPVAIPHVHQLHSNVPPKPASYHAASGAGVSHHDVQHQDTDADDLAWFFNDADDLQNVIKGSPLSPVQHVAETKTKRRSDAEPTLPVHVEWPDNLCSFKPQTTTATAAAGREPVCQEAAAQQLDCDISPQQLMLSALALTLSHGADSETHMAVAALATSISLLPNNTPTTRTELQSQKQRKASWFEDLINLCADVSWDRHIHVQEALGPSTAHSCVREGVVLPVRGTQMQHVVHCQLIPTMLANCVHSEASTSTAITSTVSAHGAEQSFVANTACNPVDDKDCEPGYITGQPMVTAFLEGGLGAHSPDHSHSFATGMSSCQPLEIRTPAWSIYEHTTCSSQITQVITKASGMTQGGTELDKAVQELASVLQPLRVQLVIMVNSLPDQLCSAMYEKTGIIILPGVPFRVLNDLARDCGVVPVAGLAGLPITNQLNSRTRQGVLQSPTPRCNQSSSRMGLAYIKVSVIEKGLMSDEGQLQKPGQFKHQTTMQQLLLLQACYSKNTLDNSLTTNSVAQPSKSISDSSCLCCVGSIPRHNDQKLRSCLSSGTLEGRDKHVAERHVPRAVTVFLSAPLPVMLQQHTHRLCTSFARILSCMQQGVVIPGAGVFELLCMHSLNDAADDLEEILAKSIGTECAHDEQQPAWKQFNVVARDDSIIWRSQVFRALSNCMHDMVSVLLQNQGHSFTQSLSCISNAAVLLSASKSNDGYTSGYWFYGALPMEMMQYAQALLHRTSDGNCNKVFVGDDKACRIQAIQAVKACVAQLLASDMHIVNQSG